MVTFWSLNNNLAKTSELGLKKISKSSLEFKPQADFLKFIFRWHQVFKSGRAATELRNPVV